MDIESRLGKIWEDVLGLKTVLPSQNYFDLGGDSSLALEMFLRIEKVFGVKLPLATLFDAPSIAEMARVLRRATSASTWTPIVAIQPLGTRPPFFCTHGAGGNVLIYRELSQHLGSNQPFYGLQARGMDGESAPLTTIEEMAALYVGEIKKMQPRGPYFLGGYCMGGTIAYEMAQQLTAQGNEIALLALFDTMNWSRINDPSAWGRTYHEGQRIAFHVANFLCLNAGGMTKFSREKLASIRSRIPVWGGMILSRLDRYSLPALADSGVLGRLWKINDLACRKYVPRPYPGKVTDFRPVTQYKIYKKPDAKWDLLAAHGQDVVTLPVYPAGMLVEPFVEYLATALAKSIDGATKPSNLVR